MFKNLKIRTTIILSFILLTLISTSVLGYVFLEGTVGILKKQINQHLETAVQSRVNNVGTIFNVYDQRITLVATRTALRRDLKSYYETKDNQYLVAIQDILMDVLAGDAKFLYVSILDINGKTIVSTDEDIATKDYSGTDRFLEGKKGNYISDLFGPDEKGAKINLSGPLYLDNEFLGVVVIGSPGKQLEDVAFEQKGLGETGEIFLINKNYLMITPSRFKQNTFLKQKIATELAEECFTSKDEGEANDADFYTDYRGVSVIGTYTYIPRMNWCMLAKYDKSELLDKPERSLLFEFIFFFIIIIILINLVGYFISRSITKPLGSLQLNIERIEKGDFEHKIDVSSENEVGQLAEAFNKMVEAVKKSRASIEKEVKVKTKEIAQREKEALDQQKAIMNVLEDVEIEKRKAEESAYNLKKFELAVEGASDQIVITDTEGIALYINKATERITGFSQKDIMGRKVGTAELWGGNMKKEFYEKMWDTIKRKKKVFVGEINNTRKNGKKYVASVSVSPILDKDNDVLFFVGIERDITKEKEIDKAKTEFVSLASHQLRTPLSAISWFTEMLIAGDAGKLNKEQKKYLQEIYNGNRNMVELVNALLNVSRIELGTFTVEPEKASVVDLVKDVIKLQKHQMDAKKIAIKEEYQSNLPDINIDKKLTTMIFQNLISNAIKYTPEKGKITVTAKKDSSNLVVSVADTGMGIPEDQKDKIFTKLFRADNVRKTSTEGTGLGLYIVKSILKSTGGEVSFTSKEGKGTTFVVKIPLKGMKSKKGEKKLT